MNESNELKQAAQTGGKQLKTYGVLAIILGLLALLAPGLTGISIALLLGVLVLMGGILRMIWAFQSGSLGKGLLRFALGALTLICGIVLLTDPLIASGVLTMMVGAYFITDGLFEIASAVSIRPAEGWGWMLFGGIVSEFLGVMIWMQFPLSGPYALGILLGIKLMFIGMIAVNAGSMVRDAAMSDNAAK